MQGYVHNKGFFGVFFLIGIILSLSACSVRRIYDQNSNFSGTSDCLTEPTGTLVPINKSWTDIKVGDSVFWLATVSGCTGRYVLNHAGGTVNFASGGPGVYTRTYTTSGSQIESVSVQSVDSAGNVLRTFTLQSQPFTVNAAMSCSVTAAATTITAPVDSAGNMPTPVNFGFVISSSSSISLNRVLEANVALAPTRLNITLPNAASTSHALMVSVPTAGAHTYQFEVKNAAGEVGSCSSTVTVTPVVTAAPTIVSFSANPSDVTLGLPVELTAVVSGDATSVEIDGVAATVTGGIAKRTVTPTATGAVTSTAKAIGTGGTTTRTVTYNVATGCALRLPAELPTVLPALLNLQVDITGQYTSAYILGTGIESVILVGGQPFTNRTIPVRMFYAPTTVSLWVYGINGSVRRCDAQITSGPLPVVNVQNSGSNGSVQVKVKSAFTLGWTTSGAGSCALKRDGVAVSNALSGTYTILSVMADTNFELSCININGTTTRTYAVDAVGGWLQANDQNCPSFCSGQGLQNVLSPDNARCASGEVRPNSAIGILSYPFGTWGTAGWTSNSSSNGNHCYGVGQVVDWDNTDRTVGCFCGP